MWQRLNSFSESVSRFTLVCESLLPTSISEAQPWLADDCSCVENTVESDTFIEYGTLSHLDIIQRIQRIQMVGNTVESDSLIEYRTLSQIIQRVQETRDTKENKIQELQ